MTNNFVVEKKDEGKRLDMFLLENMPSVTRSHIKNLIEDGFVLVDGKNKKSGEKLKLGNKISVEEQQPTMLDVVPQNIDIDIIYQDDDLAVINKKQGMVVHPANGNYDGTLVNALLFHITNLSGINGVIRPGIVHRLDKDTSGLIIIAKNDKAHTSLAKQIETKSCHRHYFALVNGNIKQDSGRIETYIGRNPKDRKQMAVVQEKDGKKAITNFNVVKRYGKYTFVEFVLETGRTHQIRVHSKHIGHTIVGDETYGHKDKSFKTNGQLLHAYKIQFTQPTTNQSITLECPLPDYFQKALNYLDNQN